MLTVAQYIVEVLASLGITECFGVPGDFSFPLDNAILEHPSIRWIGCSNELNAAYAADGYARIRGASLLCTTYAVGELSALNGVMGAKAERVPVFHLVGMPTMRHQGNHRIIHHTLGDGVFQNFAALSAAAACVSAVLTPDNVVYEMQRVIATVKAKSQPAYLLVAEDMATAPITPAASPDYPKPASNPMELRRVLAWLLEVFNAEKRIVILPSFKIARYCLQTALQDFIEKSARPFITMPMDKAILSERHPQFAGMYTGNDSCKEVLELVDRADYIVNAGGSFFNDGNTSAYYYDLKKEKIITIDIDYVQVGETIYNGVQISEVLEQLTAALPQPKHRYKAPARKLVPLQGEANARISVESLYSRYAHFIRKGDVVIAETGSQSAVSSLWFPEDTLFYNQTQWGSIGFATPCALGTALAAPYRRTVLFTGEGSHQMTANELGTMGRYGANPVIFVLNNAGYMIERALETSPDKAYNDLASWNYTELPHALGCEGWFVARVATNAELDEAMKKAQSYNGASYIEILAGRTDYPPGLQRLHQRLMQMYGFENPEEIP